MKNLIGIDIGSYSFNPEARTITIGGLLSTLKKEQLLIVTNVTNNIMLYNFADPTYGATITNNIITLSYNTSGMTSTDNLQIFVEVNDNGNDQAQFQRMMLQFMRSLGVVDANNRQRVAVEAMPTTTVTLSSNAVTVSSGTITSNVNNAGVLGGPMVATAVGAGTLGYIQEGPVNQLWRYYSGLHTNYNTGNRNNLKFS